ncbi:MAG: molybdate ABC transporter substrate-binding protein [Acidobacteriota bacterium]|nr:molybdate ABC transporter substrate-binding protein [Acidobacteriota bacterium]
MVTSLLHVLLALLLATSAAPAAPAARTQPETLVFAAASLSDVLTEIGHAYEAAEGGKVAFNFAGSNDLARQIEAGAPAAIFVSANRAQADRLEKAGRIRRGESFALLGNSLVVVVPRDSPTTSLAGSGDLVRFERLSLADPEGVPAGVYAKAWLTREGVWPRIAPKVVPALDVRAALAAVAAGNLPAGIVYATDAAHVDNVKVVFRVPAEATPDLRYYAAPIAPGSPAAASFVAFLKGAKAREIFSRAGFIPMAISGKPGG